jgi:hypothetical protein
MVYPYGTAERHRFQVAREAALGKVNSRFGTNAGDYDATVKRLSTPAFYDTDSRGVA